MTKQPDTPLSEGAKIADFRGRRKGRERTAQTGEINKDTDLCCVSKSILHKCQDGRAPTAALCTGHTANNKCDSNESLSMTQEEPL